jgi:6-phosphogluconolactonase
MRRMVLAVPPLAVALSALALAAGPAAADGPHSTVYTSSNSSSGNAVLTYDRARDGSLRPAGSFATGGNGTGGGLNNQGALALGPDGRTLYVVNAGSNSVSAFAVRHHRLDLIGTTSSSGPEPVSIAVRGDRLFVLNAGDNSVSGFRAVRDGGLVSVPGSTTALPGAGPAQVSFADGDRALVVTERDSNSIVTVPVSRDGALGSPVSTTSSGATPFGFDTDNRNHVIVSEAGGGPNGTSAVTSYNLQGDGSLTAISPSVGDNQNAACWLAVTKDGRFAYTANAASASISSYVIGHDGSISLLHSVAAANAPGSHTTDLAEPDSESELFALTAGVGTLSGYRIGGHGDLVATGTAPGVPGSATGLVAR